MKRAQDTSFDAAQTSHKRHRSAGHQLRRPVVHNPAPSPPTPDGHSSRSAETQSGTRNSTRHAASRAPVRPVLFEPAVGLPDIPDIDSKYEEQLFTHPSVHDAKYGSRIFTNYERLEWYGDACIQMIATRLIFTQFSHLRVGEQVSLREELVCNKNLARFSRAYKLDERLKIFGKIDEKTAADVFEAYVAAVTMSDEQEGWSTAEKWLAGVWAQQLAAYKPQVAIEDFKGELQRRIGGRSDDGRDVFIEYRVTKPSDRYSQTVEVEAYLNGWGRNNFLLGKGVGKGKVQAGMLAAQSILDTQEELLKTLEARKKIYDDRRREEKAQAEATKADDADAHQS